MSRWYYQVKSDIANVVAMIDFFEKESESAKADLSLRGKSVERHSSELPGIFETRYAQLQEIEAVLEFLNVELKKKRGEAFKKYLENYARSLTSRDCEKYVDCDAGVVDMTLLTNEVALLRNKYLGLIKALDSKQWQITNIVKLRVAGLEDVKVD